MDRRQFQEIESVDIGNSRFYIILEQPLPLPLIQGVSSPVPPPRTRQNPFNKPEITPHQRSYSMRSNMQTSKFIFLFIQKLNQCNTKKS